MSYVDDARTTMIDMLDALLRMVEKAEAGGLDDAVLEAKLAEDMFTLEAQFRTAVNQVLVALGRTCNTEMPLDEVPYETLAQVRDRVSTIRAIVDEASADSWASPDSVIDMTLPNGMRFVLTTAEYFRDWMLPNFYFHVSMAYALLRQQGLILGKADFIAHMTRYARAPED